MTEVGNGGLEESLKAAAADIRDSVAKYGSVHAIVLQKLEAYIDLLVQTDAPQSNIDAWRDRADGVRRALPSPKTNLAVGKTDDGVFSLDDADDDESISYDALEQFVASKQSEGVSQDSSQRASSNDVSGGSRKEPDSEPAAAEQALSQVAPQASKDAAVIGSAPDLSGTNPADGNTIYLFDISGLHVACAFQNGVYTPDGKNIGRYQADFDVFVDKRGNYMGQIYDQNRFIRDPHFKYATFNFGDRGNEGDRPGWGRKPDTDPTSPPDWYEDVKLPKGDLV